MDRTGSASEGIFNVARRRAFVQDVLALLSGRSDDLLAFDQVREQLHLSEPTQDATLQEIPLDKIVGSVGRYRDFNRAFLPREPIDAGRWTRIERLRGQVELPPIDVFQVGDVYFVQDGNHRVSVARARKQKTIWAHVINIPVRVPLGPDTSPDDLILKADYAEFLEKTSLDRSCPEQHIELTRPGGYRSLVQHIEVHQFYMGLRSRHYPTLAEAAADWYHSVYLPVVETIRASEILSRFPGRTEADLYLWIAENRAGLQIRYGVSEEAQEAVDDFAQEHQVPAICRWVRRLIHRVFPRTRLLEPQWPSQAAIPPSDDVRFSPAKTQADNATKGSPEREKGDPSEGRLI
jgi:uncharacterized ParB-like nuclease family protein